MSREIIVRLKTEAGTNRELLIFEFENSIHIDLTSDDSGKLKDFFVDLLLEFKDKVFTLKFNNDENREDLFADVSRKYVEDLNNELKGIIPSIPKK